MAAADPDRELFAHTHTYGRTRAVVVTRARLSVTTSPLWKTQTQEGRVTSPAFDVACSLLAETHSRERFARQTGVTSISPAVPPLLVDYQSTRSVSQFSPSSWEPCLFDLPH